jgi:hypothetical protein
MTSPLSTQAESVVGDIEQFLIDLIQRLEPDQSPGRQVGPGRPRILPELCLWGALLVCVLKGCTHQVTIWRLLTTSSFWFYPRFALSDQAIYRRLATAGAGALERLFQQVSAVLRERLAPYARSTLAAFATAVVVLDETTLDQIARLLPSLRDVPAGDERLLPGKMAGLFDIRHQQWCKIQIIADPHQNEKVAAREMVAALPKGALLLADLGYFGFAWFDDLTQQGLWWLSRLRSKTSYSVIHVFHQADGFFDGIVWLGAYRADKATHAVRLVSFRVGLTTHSYITNVLDPHLFPATEIAQVYARRWDIELAIKMLKRHLNLHLWWSAKPIVIQQQLWAVLIIAQILHALHVEIAGRAGVDIFDVSLQLLVEYAPRYAADGLDVLSIFVERGRALGFIRPSTRLRPQAPVIASERIIPCPPGLVLTRQPRYAQRE